MSVLARVGSALAVLCLTSSCTSEGVRAPITSLPPEPVPEPPHRVPPSTFRIVQEGFGETAQFVVCRDGACPALSTKNEGDGRPLAWGPSPSTPNDRAAGTSSDALTDLHDAGPQLTRMPMPSIAAPEGALPARGDIVTASVVRATQKYFAPVAALASAPPSAGLRAAHAVTPADIVPSNAEAHPPMRDDPERLEGSRSEPGSSPTSAARLTVPAERHLTLYFFQGVQLTPSSRKQLADVAVLAQQAGRVVIVGHTDSTGPMPLNERLAASRAEVVRNYLQVTVPDPGRDVVVDARPACCYVAPNDRPEGRAQNRRVEIAFTLRADGTPIHAQPTRAAMPPLVAAAGSGRVLVATIVGTAAPVLQWIQQ